MGRSAILKIDIVSDFDSKGVDKATRRLDSFKQGATVAATAAAAGLAVGAYKAVQAAGDLGESVNAVNKVFGSSAKAITDFGKNAATSTGLSARSFNQLATSTGSLLTNMGYSTAQAAEQTKILATRAADMASVFNTDVETALTAINAGLRGETEPLRAFGVSINDASLKAKALELGLYSGVGSLDAHARAAAAQALILQQSAATAGDFAGTSESAANAQRIMAAEVENLTADLGTALLPAFESLLAIGRDVIGWAKDNTGTVKVLAVAVAVLAGGILAVNVAMKAYRAAVVVATAVQWAMNVALAANPIGLIVIAIAALVAGVILAYKKFEPFRRIVDSVWQAIKKAVEWVGKLIGKLANLKFPDIGGFLGKLNPFSVGIAGGSPVPATVAGVSAFGRAAPAVVSSSSSAGTVRRRAAGVSITVNGALDPESVARQITQLLGDYADRQGRPAAARALSW